MLGLMLGGKLGKLEGVQVNSEVLRNMNEI